MADLSYAFSNIIITFTATNTNNTTIHNDIYNINLFFNTFKSKRLQGKRTYKLGEKGI